MRVLIAITLLLATLAGCSDATPTEATDDTFADFGDADLSSGLGLIRGVVVDQAIVPIEGATVRVVGQELSAETNGDGAFQFANVQPGFYNVEVSKLGWSTERNQVEVVADEPHPAVVRVLLTQDASELPAITPVHLKGTLTCGVAVVATSVGCTTYGPIAEQIGDQSVFSQDYDVLPDWLQGELIWTSTQTLSGDFIWEIVQSEYPGSPQPHIGYRETAPSPALAYLDNSTIDEYQEWILDKGVDWRFFGGPHELTRGVGFGVGVTLQQDVEIIIHEFYNMVPDEGWRFTNDGDHPIPS